MSRTSVRCLTPLGAMAGAALMAASLPALAQVSLAPAAHYLEAESTCRFLATVPGGVPPALEWRMMEPGGGTLTAGPGGTGTYHAPAVSTPTTFHVQVSIAGDASSTALSAVHVKPQIPGMPDYVATVLLPAILGPDWMAAVPSQRTFLKPSRTPVSDLGALCFVDEGSALAGLERSWLVATSEGLGRMSGEGDLSPLPEPFRGRFAQVQDISSMASRPRGSAPGNPLHVVLSQNVQAGPGRPVHGLVWALEPDGKARLLAGSVPQPSCCWCVPPSPWRDGPGPEAVFGAISALAMDREGHVFVADRGNNTVRVINPEGKVSTLAGVPGGDWDLHRNPMRDPALWDGPGRLAGFQQLRGMALDPDLGTLYVADHHSIRAIAPDGDVRTVLGLSWSTGFEPVPPGQPMPNFMPCLNGPASLQFFAGRLFIADKDNHAIRVFDPVSRILATLAGDPSQSRLRPGALRHFSPTLAPQERSAIPFPAFLAINPDATCLVVVRDSIEQLDLGAFSVDPIGPPAPWGGEEKREMEGGGERRSKGLDGSLPREPKRQGMEIPLLQEFK